MRRKQWGRDFETDVEAQTDFTYTPTESAYLSYQDKRRLENKPLRPSDHAYNERVSHFFGNVIPGLPIDADPPQTRLTSAPFAQTVERILKRLDIAASPFLDTLAENWPKILPPEIATATRPGKWDAAKRILYVHVPTHTQLFELRRTALTKIETAVRAFAKEVRSVHLMVDTSRDRSSQVDLSRNASP